MADTDDVLFLQVKEARRVCSNLTLGRVGSGIAVSASWSVNG